MIGIEPEALAPVRIAQTTLVIDEHTGLVVEWKGLNSARERCPALLCDGCARRCGCAPCRCARCRQRAQVAPDGSTAERGQLVLL